MLLFPILFAIPSILASCPQDWFYFKETNSCYFWSEYNTWTAAEEFCSNKGAHLSSVHSKNELDFLQSIHNGDLWIGLNAKKSPIEFGTVWSWTDGSSVNYTLWSGVGMPMIGGDRCVMTNGGFSNVNCNSSKYSICKRSFETFCPDGWKFYESTNSCFLISTSNKLNWTEAERYCVSIGAHLASFHNYDEYNFLVHPYAGSPLWIGLSTNSTPVNWNSTWKWTDSTNVDFLRWDVGVPSLTDKPCVLLQSFFFSNENCFFKTYPLCKKSSTKIISSTPAPTTPPPNKCPINWKYFEKTNSCYFYITSPLNWTTSENYCAFYGGNRGGHLLSIHSLDEYNFVQNYVPQYGSYYWTGLYSDNNALMWKWTDGTPFDYKIWAPGYPIRSGAVAALIYFDAKGFTNNFDPKSIFSLICKTPAK